MSIKILSDNEIKIYLTNIRCFDISWIHVFFFMLFVKQFDVTYGWYFVSRSYIGLHNKYCFMKGGDGYYEKIIYIIHNGIALMFGIGLTNVPMLIKSAIAGACECPEGCPCSHCLGKSKDCNCKKK